MVKDAFFFLIPLLAGAVVALWVGQSGVLALGFLSQDAWNAVGVGLLILLGFVGCFFRDPERLITRDTSIIVSPADGRVVRIENQGAATRISIFLSIFDVHVNRSPIGGTVTDVEYRKGRFRAAFNHLASVENERNTLTIRDNDVAIACSQIAGLVARRIVCWKKAGDAVRKGERIGLIRFGSRVDLLLPAKAVLTVQVGDKVRGGSSAIARLTT